MEDINECLPCICGHNRKEHAEEQNYECFNCDCLGFELAPDESFYEEERFLHNED